MYGESMVKVWRKYGLSMAKSMVKVWRKYGKSMAHTSKVWPIYGLAIPIPDFEKPSPYPYPKFLKISNPDPYSGFLTLASSTRG